MEGIASTMDIFDILLTLGTLTILEIILGIDNLVFLTITTQRLPPPQQKSARQLGLTLAWVFRLVLLFSAVWLTKLTTPLLNIFSYELTGRDLFLLAGGIFLIVKSAQEIRMEIIPAEKTSLKLKKNETYFWVIVQIAMLDMVFSLDSVLTAIGLTNLFWLMATAITIAILLMVFASEFLSKFINKHPAIKMLALGFLVLIGLVLIAEAIDFHIARTYIYFAMGFSLFVETLNILKKNWA